MAPSATRARSKRQPVMSSNIKMMNMGISNCGCYASSCSKQVLLNDIHVQADGEEEEENSSSGCCTPKAQKFRIPEVLSCPPAPKKRRVLRNYVSKSSSPIAFFAHPDIELFFLCTQGCSLITFPVLGVKREVMTDNLADNNSL